MKNRFFSLPIKAVAVVLATLAAIAILLTALGGVLLIDEDFYTRSESAVLADVYRDILNRHNYRTMSYYYDGDLERAAEFSDNYYFEIRDENGDVLGGNYQGQRILLAEVTTANFEYYNANEDEWATRTYTVTGYLAEDLTGTDVFTTANSWVTFLYRMRYTMFILLALSLLIEIGLLIFLFCSAGRHPGEELPRLNPLDKLPFDVVTAALAVVLLLEGALISEYADGWIWCIPFGLLDFLLLLWYSMSFATRMKVGHFVRTTLLGKLAILLGKGCRALGRKLRLLVSNLPLVWKTALILGGITVAEFFLLATVWSREGLFILWFLEKLIVIPVVLLTAISLRKLQEGGRRLAEGGIDERVNTDYLIGEFKDFGRTLNSIGDGLNRAVEERMKSERFKTELITNVSHDIKTPLTSIINYVDLIKKQQPEDETLCQYIDVLDRQSARLKKLIEDLVEASKASTGNLAVHPEPCDAGVLLTQLLGEYDERFREKGLEPILKQPETAVFVVADPRHLWRILDNLMVNILKYAQSGTRVYLDLFADQRAVTLLFRNISRAPLHISGEELTERFVRGDSSRNTEGSGLGLSIASSLTELQGGKLTIDVDGDLFKVTLRFPR